MQAFFCLFVKDRNNYSNAIAGAVAIVLYFVAGLQLFVGVALEGAVYRFGFLAWIFIIVGSYRGLSPCHGLGHHCRKEKRTADLPWIRGLAIRWLTPTALYRDCRAQHAGPAAKPCKDLTGW
ncbi:hypothetical protein [Methanosarcina horonobensis]|uniref:hypothetical protein n=1 Tax=Methanosarcina horonobensis TaxID=418008 RepID=UPI000AF4994D|nr:hypothetical protein [Methanosarcina horonobensis]